jgi:hypothetical protein
MTGADSSRTRDRIMGPSAVGVVMVSVPTVGKIVSEIMVPSAIRLWSVVMCAAQLGEDGITRHFKLAYKAAEVGVPAASVISTLAEVRCSLLSMPCRLTQVSGITLRSSVLQGEDRCETM